MLGAYIMDDTSKEISIFRARKTMLATEVLLAFTLIIPIQMLQLVMVWLWQD